MEVVIGIDPHKASHTAVAIDRSEVELANVRVRATRRQVDQLLRWAEPFEKRTWAIESAGGVGYLLAQQLVARGEEVFDVPPTLASRVRVLATTRSNKNDPNDAFSVALAALRTPRLRAVEAANHTEVLRLLSKRNTDIGSHRTRVVCRLHALFQELAPGGIAKKMNASDARPSSARLSRRRRPSRSDSIWPPSSSKSSGAPMPFSRRQRNASSGRQGLRHDPDRPLWNRPSARRSGNRLQRRRAAIRQP
jgi:transposase